MKYKVKVLKCEYCGHLVGVIWDEKLTIIDDSDLEEHCMYCIATVDDFREIKTVEVDAESIGEAIDKAVEIVGKEVDSDETA